LNKSVVFTAGAARSHTPMSTIYLHRGGYIIMRDMVRSDTCTVRWEIHYVHSQSDKKLF